MVVKQSGRALEFVSPELQADAEVVMTAVQEDGLAIQFADPALQADEAIMAQVIASVLPNYISMVKFYNIHRFHYLFTLDTRRRGVSGSLDDKGLRGYHRPTRAVGRCESDQHRVVAIYDECVYVFQLRSRVFNHRGVSARVLALRAERRRRETKPRSCGSRRASADMDVRSQPFCWITGVRVFRSARRTPRTLENVRVASRLWHRVPGAVNLF